MMKIKHSVLFSLLGIVGCNFLETKELEKKEETDSILYVNKAKYIVSVGDTIEIYHSTNSCCKYCQPNASDLKCMEYIGQKVVIPEKVGCYGCNHTSALMFVARREGIDTIKDGIIHPLEACVDTIKGLSSYIVYIR